MFLMGAQRLPEIGQLFFGKTTPGNFLINGLDLIAIENEPISFGQYSMQWLRRRVNKSIGVAPLSAGG
jgi:hypothetical protein